MKYIRSTAFAIALLLSAQSLQAQSRYINHTLKQGETLSALAKQYNTSVGDIMRANGMHADTRLVYGSNIKIPSTKQAAVAAKTTAPAVSASPVSTPSSGEITHLVAKGETLYSISKKYNVTVDQLKAWNNLTDNSAKLGTLLIVNESGVNRMAKTTTTPKPQTETAAPQQQQKEPVEENKPGDSPAPADNVTKNVQPAGSMEPASNDIASYSGEGFFAPEFKEKKNKGAQNMSGVSKTFKTASGWADGKYYILANDIEPGTIVKLSADNGSSVYAKVLWNMGDLKDNAGINFRISNATAAALHVNDAGSFNLNVSF
ncbi:LysM peptidoglycan-binding domain-containing protein [Parafilimonas sp.]|uniref:LysM peptidoglycan-binding domain-containing protein n=1 Tax=Parafilimonas sp. TaxID=1969739 RepID=UPI0039E7206A